MENELREKLGRVAFRAWAEVTYVHPEERERGIPMLTWETLPEASQEFFMRIGEAVAAALIEPGEYIDELTGVRMMIERDNPAYPGYPKITVICPEQHILSLSQINGALHRLRQRVGISPAQFPDLALSEVPKGVIRE